MINKIALFFTFAALAGCQPVRSGNAVDACKADPLSSPNCGELANSVSPEQANRNAAAGIISVIGGAAGKGGQRQQMKESRQKVCNNFNRCYYLTGDQCSQRMSCGYGEICLIDVGMASNRFAIGECAEPE